MQWNAERWYISLWAVYYPSHSQLFFVIKKFKNLQLQHEYISMALFNPDQNFARWGCQYTTQNPHLNMVSTFKLLGNKKPVVVINKLLTFLGEPWHLLQGLGFNFELTAAYEFYMPARWVSFLLAGWYIIESLIYHLMYRSFCTTE